MEPHQVCRLYQIRHFAKRKPDINKFIRAAYGPQVEYQRLSCKAIDQWNLWNDEIRSGVDLPAGMTPDDTLFARTGNLWMSDSPEISTFDVATIANMKAAGRDGTQMILTNPEDVARAKAQGFGHAVNPFSRRENHGILDMSAGIVYADKACRFALHKAVALGVKTVFGSMSGKFEGFLETEGIIRGISTVDGKQHPAALTIMACGGWTPALVPQLDGLCETTAGSVALFQVPRSSDLWDRLGPEKFPAWT